MLYFVKRRTDNSELAYLTENRAIIPQLGSKTLVEKYEDISLMDVIARIAYGQPKINPLKDEDKSYAQRYPGTIISEDISLLESYLKESKKMLSLDDWDPKKDAWKDQRKALREKLENAYASKNK